ncbi:hypothetical protein V8E53_002249 [Lactarius tabidus]
MAPVPKYLCPCFKCKSEKKERVKRTILTHFKDNLDHLNNLRASGAHQDTLSFLLICLDPTSAPYPDGIADAHYKHDDDDYDPFPSYPMMDEDFPEWDYRLHLGNDEKCHFNIPEQILQRDEVGDLGSNSRLPNYQTEDEELSSDSDQVDHQDQNDSFAEPDDLGSDEANRP